MSQMKKAFEEARNKKNIGLILPEFLSSVFYAVGLDDDNSFDFALTKSPDQKEMCVTISDNPELVSFERWSVKEVGGRELLKSIPQNAGILLTYNFGGDYITRNQIDWFLEVLD